MTATIDAETLVVGRDLAVDPAEGILRLLRRLDGDTMQVRYEVVPLALPRVFQSVIPPDTAGADMSPIPPSKGRVREIASQARLDLRGSKTISLEIGSGQDLTVRQSLDVALSGTVAPGVEVRGVLSDRETPLQSEGRTTELADLDRVYLQVDGPGAGMTLGDFTHAGPPGLFTAYDRQLEGIRLHGARGPANLVVAAATLPGEFVSLEFLGEEGRQGPYALRAPRESFDAVVLSGSEKVWVDEERMVRGEDRDYVIDYAAATITFTGRRIIHSDSRITVDYQIRSQPYQRNVYVAEAGWGVAEEETGFRFGASLLSERDDTSE
ncbi:MAG: hypothetical protein GF346_04660, partial [Candidatus Eisenbacteria bacterium]|nr:hypothetical protein [Candidatus Latescibacterota bacterium]MBD3301717.1 hypothetical protein [Candidatus Eisenbacteria bacterium]